MLRLLQLGEETQLHNTMNELWIIGTVLWGIIYVISEYSDQKEVSDNE